MIYAFLVGKMKRVWGYTLFWMGIGMLIMFFVGGGLLGVLLIAGTMLFPICCFPADCGTKKEPSYNGSYICLLSSLNFSGSKAGSTNI